MRVRVCAFVQLLELDQRTKMLVNMRIGSPRAVMTDFPGTLTLQWRSQHFAVSQEIFIQHN